jgi:transcriptional regulator with XRE-family HTH domain
MQPFLLPELLDIIMYLSDNFGMGTVGRGGPASEVLSGNHFGTWLRQRRKARDLTGEALAFRMGGKLTQSSISHYERGTKKPEAATVFLLAQALGADPREALEALMADTPGLEAIPTKEAAPDVAQLLRFYGDLSPERKVKVLEKAADLYQLTAYEAGHWLAGG